MKPLNASERTQGLLKFAGIFLFTIVLVIFAVYFNNQAVPKRQLEIYKEQNAALTALVDSDARLIGQLAQLNSAFIDYQKDPNNQIALSAAGSGINELKNLAKTDSTSYSGRFCNQVSVGYSIALDAIGKLKDNGNTSEAIQKVKDDLKDCKDKLKEKEDEIADLRAQLSAKKK